MTKTRLATVLWLLTLLAGTVFGQATSSSIVGTVTDSSGAAMANIKVELKDEGTGAVRTSETTTEGNFRFNAINPSTYSIKIEAQGFKGYAQSAIKLASSETRDLGRIAMAVGALSEQVTVEAQASAVQTASSEKGALVEGAQLNNVALKGRDLFGAAVDSGHHRSHWRRHHRHGPARSDQRWRKQELHGGRRHGHGYRQ
jgi:hypothetical protein